MAQLRELYQYFTNAAGPQDVLNTPNTSEMSDADFYAGLLQNQPSYEYQGNSDRGAQFGVRQGSFLDQLQQKTPGAYTMGQDGMRFDFSKLPRTRFGSVEETVPVESYTPLVNPRGVVNDDNYGNITSRANIRRDNAWLGPLLMMAMGAGMGGLVGAAGGGSAFKTASAALRGVQSGIKGNPLSALAGLTGLGGAPSWASSLARLAASRFGGRG
jgi:hypothetical protein